MTKDSLFKMLVPRRLRKLATRYVKEGRVPATGRPASVRGMGRASRRRELRSDARWQHANQVALPHRTRKQRQNVALLKLAAIQAQARLAVVMRLFGKRAA